MSDWLMVILTFFYVIFTWKILKSNKQLIIENTRTRNEAYRPEIVAYFSNVEGLCFEIKNIGSRLALNTLIEFDPDILQGIEIDLKDIHILKSGIKVIAPDQIFAMWFPYDEIKNHILEIDPNNTRPLETTIKLSYFDIEGKEYLTEYKIDLDNYKGVHVKGGNFW